jgi:8-oxo-dGTP pyrophosphatase MutT (NUDIX family)
MPQFLYKAVHIVVRMYWFILRPKTYGALCLIECNGKILLVKNSYGRDEWTFPGGGIKKGEEAIDAARREVSEEVGIDVSNLEHLGNFLDTTDFNRDFVECFFVTVQSESIIVDCGEIKETRWFPLNEIPEGVKPQVGDLIKKYMEIKKQQG